MPSVAGGEYGPRVQERTAMARTSLAPDLEAEAIFEEGYLWCVFSRLPVEEVPLLLFLCKAGTRVKFSLASHLCAASEAL